jgi:hypothetical protein
MKKRERQLLLPRMACTNGKFIKLLEELLIGPIFKKKKKQSLNSSHDRGARPYRVVLRIWGTQAVNHTITPAICLEQFPFYTKQSMVLLLSWGGWGQRSEAARTVKWSVREKRDVRWDRHLCGPGAAHIPGETSQSLPEDMDLTMSWVKQRPEAEQTLK